MKRRAFAIFEGNQLAKVDFHLVDPNCKRVGELVTGSFIQKNWIVLLLRV